MTPNLSSFGNMTHRPICKRYTWTLPYSPEKNRLPLSIKMLCFRAKWRKQTGYDIKLSFRLQKHIINYVALQNNKNKNLQAHHQYVALQNNNSLEIAWQVTKKIFLMSKVLRFST